MALRSIVLVFAVALGFVQMQPLDVLDEEHFMHESPMPTPQTVQWFYGNLDLSFSCANRVYGYYADVKNDCHMFHVCHEGADGHMIKSSFFCGNGTLFSQDALVCTLPEDAFPCELAESLYHLNERFGQEEQKLATTIYPDEDQHE